MNGEVVPSLTTKEFGLSKNPVGQQATVADPTDLATSINAIKALIDRLQEFGFIE